MNHSVKIRKVAVLGAGVMGAQIAAHLVNANVETLLFELPAKEGSPHPSPLPEGEGSIALSPSGGKLDRGQSVAPLVSLNGNVNKALAGLKKLDPAPLASPAKADYIRPANYAQDLEKLRECDLIIEAIAERIDWKSDLYRKVAPFVHANAIFASNTSGLSINTLAEAFPENLRHRFCGIHFFNPPRYMHLVELIPCAATEAGCSIRWRLFWSLPWVRAWCAPRTPPISSPTASGCSPCSPPNITRRHSISASTWWMR